MPPVLMYSSNFCPFCHQAKAFLREKNIPFEEIVIDGDPQKRREMIERSSNHTVPQIWIGDYHVGGSDDLFALEQAHQLDTLLLKT